MQISSRKLNASAVFSSYIILEESPFGCCERSAANTSLVHFHRIFEPHRLLLLLLVLFLHLGVKGFSLVFILNPRPHIGEKVCGKNECNASAGKSRKERKILTVDLLLFFYFPFHPFLARFVSHFGNFSSSRNNNNPTAETLRTSFVAALELENIWKWQVVPFFIFHLIFMFILFCIFHIFFTLFVSEFSATVYLKMRASYFLYSRIVFCNKKRGRFLWNVANFFVWKICALEGYDFALARKICRHSVKNDLENTFAIPMERTKKRHNLY